MYRGYRVENLIHDLKRDEYGYEKNCLFIIDGSTS